jgi:hypothetical protein
MEDFSAGFDFDMDSFSDEEVDMDMEFETRYIKPPKTKEISEINLKYSDAGKLAKEIKIEAQSRYFAVIAGSFYFGDFIEALIIENNWLVKEMTISTLSLNENNIDSLVNLIEGDYLQKLNIIISDFFFSHERHNLVKYMYQELDKDNRFQLAVAGTHCKLCIFKTACGKYIVIHGSANLRSSGNIEQIVIEESKVLFDFNNKYQNAIISKYKTINKPIRHKKLWQAVVQEKVEAPLKQGEQAD